MDEQIVSKPETQEKHNLSERKIIEGFGGPLAMSGCKNICKWAKSAVHRNCKVSHKSVVIL